MAISLNKCPRDNTTFAPPCWNSFQNVSPRRRRRCFAFHVEGAFRRNGLSRAYGTRELRSGRICDTLLRPCGRNNFPNYPFITDDWTIIARASDVAGELNEWTNIEGTQTKAVFACVIILREMQSIRGENIIEFLFFFHISFFPILLHF